MLRNLRETKREKITGDWKKLHTEELFYFYHHQTILGWYNEGRSNVQEIWHLRRGIRNAYRRSVGKTEVKRTLESPKRRWGDNIEMDLEEKK